MRKGFALLEVMIVVAVVAAIGTLSIPLLQQWQFRSDVSLAKSQVLQGLQMTRQYAMAGKSDTSWSFFIPGGVVFPGTDYETATTDPAVLPHIVQISMPDTVRFEGLSQVTFDRSGKPNIEGTVTLIALNNEYQNIAIVISVNAGTITATDVSSSSSSSSSSSTPYVPPVCNFFSVNASNVIAISTPTTVTFENLGALRQSGGSYVDTYDCYSSNNGSNYSRMFQSGGCNGASVNGWGNAVTPGGGEDNNVSFSAGNSVVLKVRNYWRQVGFLSIDDTYNSKDHPARFVYLRDGQSIDIASPTLASLLQANGNVDGSGLVNLTDCQMILATEMETPYASGDYIDSVIRLTFQ